MSDFQQVFSGSGKTLLTVVFGLIPGLSRWRPRTPLSLPGVSGRLHGDGSARVLLHLLIAEFRGEGCSGGSVSRKVRVCLCLATEEFIAFRRCFLPLSYLPGHCSRSSFPQREKQVWQCTHLHRHFRCLNPAFLAALECLPRFCFPKISDQIPVGLWLESIVVSWFAMAGVLLHLTTRPPSPSPALLLR